MSLWRGRFGSDVTLEGAEPNLPSRVTAAPNLPLQSDVSAEPFPTECVSTPYC